MSSPYNWLLGLMALITGAANATVNREVTLGPALTPADLDDDPSISKTIVKRFSGNGSWVLAQHRSHSSHSSHSSHRSHSSHSSHFSSSGGGRVSPLIVAPPAPAPVPAPPPEPTAPRATAPLATVPSAANGATTEAQRLAIRVQLALNSGGYCRCKVDGIWGRETEKALRSFQKDNGLRETGVPDLETLKRLGISF